MSESSITVTGPNDSALAQSGGTPRRLWVIVALGLLFGPFVLVYCGRLRRALCWELAKWVIWVAAVCAALFFPSGRAGLFGGLLAMMLFYVALIWDAWSGSRAAAAEPPKVYQKWWAYLVLLAIFADINLSVLDASKAYLQESFLVPMGSMEPTVLPGDRFLADKLSLRFRKPQRGEVVLLRIPDARDNVYIKRVIAIAGDTIEIKSDKVLVNETEADEPHAAFLGDPPPIPGIHDYRQAQVPEDHVFVLGDNRWNSTDSRFFGFVPVTNVLGLPRVIFWSRELRLVEPTRERPYPSQDWGAIRWERIGLEIK